ncbi:MAG: glycosyltransferase family 2 protein [Eubacteriales bacterium]|nr:glycosyltransferase family 2 protein [Eubacteriales bacterium]
MLFSFIVPVYNTSKYLGQCMESILSQKGADFEIVLIDDGSTDNSGEMCDSYAKQYPDKVRVIHKDNEGLLLTRRRGFKEAKGDWFICVDSDDYVNSDLLESVVLMINKYSPDMVMYNFQYFFEDGTFAPSRLKIANETLYIGEDKQKIYAHRLLTDDVNSLCCKALKREIVDIDTDYADCEIRNMCEDAVQVLPVFTNAQRIVYLSEPLYCYRKSQGAITSSRTYSSWMATKITFSITEKYLDIWGVSDELRQKFYTHNTEVLSNFLRWLFAQNSDDLPLAKEEIIHTISKSPAYSRCIQMYNKSYATTSYLKFSVPLVMKKLKKENVKGLRRFFALEKRILKIK